MAQQPSIDGLSTEHLHADLKGRSVRGGLLTLTSQGAQFLIQSVSTVVLARLLTPADFGLVAMVTAITGLANAFADLGLSEATIQRKEINHNQVSTLFWINVAVGLGLMLATAASGPLLAWFYREPQLKGIALAVSLSFLIAGLGNQPQALLKRQMRYVSLAIRDISSYVVAVLVAVTMAWRGAGYWALVSLPLTLNATQVVLSWLMVRWRPGLPRRDPSIPSMVAFGGNVAASYFISNVTRSVDNVLIGWYWGAGPLGFYSRAYNLLMLPVRQLTAPAASVAVPAFSRLQSDPDRFARYYLRAASLMTWITAPLFGFLFVAAQPVIVLVLGRQWRDAAPVFQFLAVCGLAQLHFQSTMWLFVSRGQSARLLKLLLITSPILIASFAIGLPFGIKGVALAGSLVLIAMLPWAMHFTFRGTSITLKQLWQAIVYPISLCAAGIVLAELALKTFRTQHDVSRLLVAALGFASAYAFAALIRPVREEVMSFKSLIGAVGVGTQAAESAGR